MSDVTIVQTTPKTSPNSLMLVSQDNAPKRYTRLALIVGILLIVFTMFGLGVYIIEITPVTVSDLVSGQSELASSKDIMYLPRAKGKGSVGGASLRPSNRESNKSANLAPDQDFVTETNNEDAEVTEISEPSSQFVLSDHVLTGKNVEFVEIIDGEFIVKAQPVQSSPHDTEITNTSIETNEEQIDNHPAESVSAPINEPQVTQINDYKRRPLVSGQRIGGIGKNQNSQSVKNRDRNVQSIAALVPTSTPNTEIFQPGMTQSIPAEQDETAENNDSNEIQTLPNSIAMLDAETQVDSSTSSNKQPNTLESTKALNLTKDGLAIIVNSQNDQVISLSDLKNFYTDKISVWKSGQKISIYHLPLDSTARSIFSKRILNMTALEAATLESNRAITNSSINPPLTKASNLVKAYVARNPGAIGYIPLSDITQDPGIRIVMTLNN